mgnify:CR=1 FL=1
MDGMAIKTVSLDDTYIPNKLRHINKWCDLDDLKYEPYTSNSGIFAKYSTTFLPIKPVAPKTNIFFTVLLEISISVKIC